jgi:hypothetical membrane protein
VAYSDKKIAGAALFIGAVQFGIGLILAEIYYPNYNVSLNYVSDLGATCGPTCQIFQPSSTIFNASIIIFGLLILAGSYFLNRSFHSRLFTGLVVVAGIGLVGVGTFPETTGIYHSIFSLITFLFSGLSAVVAYRYQRAPMSFFSVILGLATLVSLLLYTQHIYLGLGNGGMERMVVYPVLLWAVGFGGGLMSSEGPY